MTEVTAAGPAGHPGAGRTARRGRGPAPLLAVTGCLPDGTPFYAPVGEVVTSGDLVVCHLCGRLQRSVTAHLRAHRWTKDDYRAAFGLEQSQSLEGAATRKLRSAAFTARLLFEPAVREGSAAGRARARAGQLTRDAAAAARGRPLPEQRRRKAARALASVSPDAVARANRDRATRQVTETAAAVAARAGHPAIGDLVLARLAAGASLAAISREAACTRTGSRGTWARWIRRPPPPRRPREPGRPPPTSAGSRPCAASASPTSPAICGTGTTART